MKLRKLKTLLVAGVALCTAVFTGCGQGADEAAATNETVTIETSRGEVTVPKNPKNVVVLDYGSLDTMDALGIEVGSLGISKQVLPPYLEKFKDEKYKDIGGIKELDFEAISKMKPDLIICNLRQGGSYDELTKIAPTIDMSVDHENYRATIERNVKSIGAIFGKEAEAEEAAKTLDGELEAAKAKSADTGKGLLVMTTGGKLHAFGDNTRFGLLYNALDLGTVVDSGSGDASGHGQTISFEYIAEKNPAYILVLDRDAAIGQGGAGKSTMENDLVRGTDAGKNDKIIYLTPSVWYLSGGGLVSTKLMLDELAPILK